MVDQILEKWIEPRLGELKEHGEKRWNPLANGNGIAEAGETFEHEGIDFTLTSQDLSSYEDFGNFLEKITGAKVDFIRNDGGGLKYLVYRHARDGDYIIDSSGKDLYKGRFSDTPNYQIMDNFAADYAWKIIQFTDACDFEGVDRLSKVYNNLISSAKLYAKFLGAYSYPPNAKWEQDYHAAKAVFYSFQPVNRCAPQQASEPHSIPDETKNR